MENFRKPLYPITKTESQISNQSDPKSENCLENYLKSLKRLEKIRVKKIKIIEQLSKTFFY